LERPVIVVSFAWMGEQIIEYKNFMEI